MVNGFCFQHQDVKSLSDSMYFKIRETLFLQFNPGQIQTKISR